MADSLEANETVTRMKKSIEWILGPFLSAVALIAAARPLQDVLTRRRALGKTVC